VSGRASSEQLADRPSSTEAIGPKHLTRNAYAYPWLVGRLSDGDLAAPLGGQGAAAMMAFHPRSLSGLGLRASEVGCKVRSYFFPSGGICIQSVCFEPCATLIRRTRRTPGRLDADDEVAPAVCGLLLTARCGYKTVVFQCYDHVICVCLLSSTSTQREFGNWEGLGKGSSRNSITCFQPPICGAIQIRRGRGLPGGSFAD
jgi:hypothetical protein